MSHEKPLKQDEWGFSHPEPNQFLVDGSKPGGQAFIAAVENVSEDTVDRAAKDLADTYADFLGLEPHWRNMGPKYRDCWRAIARRTGWPQRMPR